MTPHKTLPESDHQPAGAPADLFCPIPNCPVVASSQRAAARGQDLARAVRKLRREMNRCQRCPQKEQCAYKQHIDRLVLRAISDVCEIWRSTSLDHPSAETNHPGNPDKP
ncbi:MAG: hypothetical protein IBX69_18705 [Anaerolineales bacterium]|nr:hypothetical protein [Anaerolineales bacterium]